MKDFSKSFECFITFCVADTNVNLISPTCLARVVLNFLVAVVAHGKFYVWRPTYIACVVSGSLGYWTGPGTHKLPSPPKFQTKQHTYNCTFTWVLTCLQYKLQVCFLSVWDTSGSERLISIMEEWLVIEALIVRVDDLLLSGTMLMSK